jgi:LDH2 family malate/lactate/ureidoglycolate dehydrogenase
MPGVERIWLPGEQSHERRAHYEREGIPLAPALMAQLDKVALELGVPTLLTT